MKSVTIAFLAGAPATPDDTKPYQGREVLSEQTFTLRDLDQAPMEVTNPGFFYEFGHRIATLRVQVHGTDETFAFPGAPPLERKVRTITTGRVFKRVRPTREELTAWYGDPEPGDHYVEEPLFQEIGNGNGRINWALLVLNLGPLELVAMTDEEKTEAQLYGEPGMRWGNPEQACPFPPCTLSYGHTGPHVDAAGIDIPPADAQPGTPAPSLSSALSIYCNCGQPGNHLPTCPRYRKQQGVG